MGDEILFRGKQCNREEYQPPDVRAVLATADIAVFDAKTEILSVCEGCGCPAYSGMHYARIEKTDMGKAESMGFAQGAPNGSEAR